MDRKVQPTCTPRRPAADESHGPGKMVFVDLNAYPHDHPSNDVAATPLLTQVSTAHRSASQALERAAQGGSELIGLVGRAPNIPIVVDANEVGLPRAGGPVNATSSAEQPPSTLIFVDSSAIQPNNIDSGFRGNAVQIIDSPIDVDDDVKILSSTRGSIQVHRAPSPTAIPNTIILDEESDIVAGSSGVAEDYELTRLTLSRYGSSHNTRNLLTNINRPINSNREVHRDLENTQTAKRKALEIHEEPERVEPKDPTPTFSCAVCWGPLVDETSTICGHIFCQVCIKAAIKAQKKCPTCRRPLNMRNIHRVYLPTPG